MLVAFRVSFGKDLNIEQPWHVQPVVTGEEKEKTCFVFCGNNRFGYYFNYYITISIGVFTRN